MKHIIIKCQSQKDFSEIKDRSHIWDLKLSTCVSYCYEDDSYKFWTYTVQNDLLEYLNGNFVIGFNSLTFDCPLLMGDKHKLDNNTASSNDKYSWYNYDILHECKKNLYAIDKNTPLSEVFNIFRKNFSQQHKGVYNLRGIAVATLNNHKNDKIENTVELFKTKKILDLIQYNLNDIILIKGVYDFIKQHGYLVNGSYDVIQFS